MKKREYEQIITAIQCMDWMPIAKADGTKIYVDRESVKLLLSKFLDDGEKDDQHAT